ncbi:Zn-dependent hydrolase [Allopusillimonas soli]|uniref:Zn-dependent hydrolase n=1 Tax=Allopusillimonas soli TaxID=659016 RepID=A0A853F8Q9_9BURK|nr:Zn-dependent hydrolase [Allopusillimonas soli]NYT36188.1 Zn-dependent hydrolase [Allopusillimonas soli]TEA76519.1 Zn-dependent hydrolase [Allopusillimonas soli]
MPENAQFALAPPNRAVLACLNAERLWHRVQTLAGFTDAQRPWTRRAFSALHAQSRDWLRGQMQEAGLQTSLDAAGNLIGRRPGRRADAAPLVTGSHCDTVMDGGRFDGIIGVLAGIEFAHALHDAQVQLDHPLEVIDFLSEEPSDYGISCVGSRGMTGLLDDAMLASARLDGETLAQGMVRVGAAPDRLQTALRGKGDTAAFVELHIEQGPVLETRGLPIGVVSHIVGIRRVALTVTGRPDHAGTTPMDLRRDALVGAARLIEGAHARAQALAAGTDYVVATVGRLDMTPNVPNAVPGHVELVLEVRSDNDQVLAGFPEAVLAGTAEGLKALRVSVDMRELSRSRPTACDPDVMRVIEAASSGLGYASAVLPSGAGHDAAYMARSGPMGMVFIPCRDGRSHCPEEWTEPEQLMDGARVLAASLMHLDVARP